MLAKNATNVHNIRFCFSFRCVGPTLNPEIMHLSETCAIYATIVENCNKQIQMMYNCVCNALTWTEDIAISKQVWLCISNPSSDHQNSINNTQMEYVNISIWGDFRWAPVIVIVIHCQLQQKRNSQFSSAYDIFPKHVFKMIEPIIIQIYTWWESKTHSHTHI